MHSRSFRSVLQVVGLGILSLLPMLALGGQHGGLITLRMKYVLGAAHKYRQIGTMNATIQATGLQGTQTKSDTHESVQQDKVTRLLPNGGAEITTVMLSEKDTEDGKPVPSHPDKTPDVSNVSARGEIISRKGMAPADLHTELLSGANAFLAMLLTGGTLPQKPVKPGDTWTQTVHLPDMPGIGSATIQSHFVRLEQVGAYRTALIHSKITIPLSLKLDDSGKLAEKAAQATSTGIGTATGTFDHYFALREGFTVRLHGEGNIDNTFRMPIQPGSPPIQGQTKIKVTLSQELVP